MNTLAAEPPGRMTMTQLRRPSSSCHGLPSRKYEIYVGIVEVGESTDQKLESYFFCCGTFDEGKEVSQFTHPIQPNIPRDKMGEIIEGGVCEFTESVKDQAYVLYEIKNGIMNGIKNDPRVRCLSEADLNFFRECLKKHLPSGADATV
jgi:hypothetical protein